MSARTSEINARLRSYEQATPQASRLNLIDWKVGDRILIKLEGMAFHDTIKKHKQPASWGLWKPLE